MLTSISTLTLLASQSDKAIPIKLSQSQTIKLAKKEKQDYTIVLTKVSSRIVPDSKATDQGQRTQDEPSKIDFTEDTGRVEKIIAVKGQERLSSALKTSQTIAAA